MSLKYSSKGGELIIEDEATSSIVWRGKPEGYSVAKVIPIEDECIVLLDPLSGPNRFKNLIRCRSDGSTVWIAELPDATGPDTFTSVDLTDSRLEASAWSGFKVSIDSKTGRIVAAEFTK